MPLLLLVARSPPLLLPFFVPVVGCWRAGSSLLPLWLLLPNTDAIMHFPRGQSAMYSLTSRVSSSFRDAPTAQLLVQGTKQGQRLLRPRALLCSAGLSATVERAAIIRNGRHRHSCGQTNAARNPHPRGWHSRA
jgi:hypothetical protein